MDCNRDEACLAKELAANELEAGNIVKARHYALKAKQLCPDLEGISHLLSSIEMHLSATFRRSGEMDYYTVLGVSPSADKETITKQYRKTALLVHPDKNKEAGSASAFKYLSNAYEILKDDTSRSAYDQRVGIQPVQQNVPVPTHTSPIFPTSTQTRFPATPSWFEPPSQTRFPPPSWQFGSQQHSWTQTKHSCAGPSHSFPHQPTPNQPGFEHRQYKYDPFQGWVPPGSSSGAAPAYYNQDYGSIFHDLGAFFRNPGVQPSSSSSTRSGVYDVPPSQHGPSTATPTTTSAPLHATKGPAKGGPPAGGRRRPTAAPRSRKRKIVSNTSEKGKETFWTRCKGCKMSYEYPSAVRNKYVRCPQCEKAFQAVETEVPSAYLSEPKEYYYSRSTKRAKTGKCSD